jgi:hypothetical protein
LSQFHVRACFSSDAHPSTIASCLVRTPRRRRLRRIFHRIRPRSLPETIQSYTRRGRISRSHTLSLPLTPLDSILQRAQVLPLPLLDDLWRGDVDGAFAPRDRSEPVLHDDAGHWQVVVGGVGNGPVAELAVVAALFHFAGPALDEAFGSLEWWAAMLSAILGHGALGTLASGRWENDGALNPSYVT